MGFVYPKTGNRPRTNCESCRIGYKRKQKPKACADCGTQIKPMRHAVRCTPCSRRRALQQSREGRRQPRICKGCSVQIFWWETGSKAKVFCSPACRHRFNCPERSCVQCSATFRPHEPTPNQRFCSNSCQIESMGGNSSKRNCEGCTRAFIRPVRCNDSARFCSRKCYWEWFRSGKIASGVKGAIVRPRALSSRPRKNQRRYRQEVWNKAPGVCHICKLSLLKELTGSHPLAWVVDHVVALAKGGDDSLGNMLPAHIVCNSVKRDRQIDLSVRAEASRRAVEWIVDLAWLKGAGVDLLPATVYVN